MSMNRKSKVWVLTASITFAASAQAAVKTFKFEDDKKERVKIDVPANWQDAQDLYGIPLVVIGPTQDGLRPSLAITPTGIADLQFDEAGLSKTQDEYKKGREAWLKTNGGKSIAYLPHQTEKWNGIEVAHSIGYRYEREGKKFVEKSYYITCNKKFYHLKSLMTDGQEKEIGKTMDKTVKSFACGEGT
jgi:hypothetical protein